MQKKLTHCNKNQQHLCNNKVKVELHGFGLVLAILLIVFLFMNNRKLAIIPCGLMLICDISSLLEYFSLYNVSSVIVDAMLIFLLLCIVLQPLKLLQEQSQ